MLHYNKQESFVEVTLNYLTVSATFHQLLKQTQCISLKATVGVTLLLCFAIIGISPFSICSFFKQDIEPNFTKRAFDICINLIPTFPNHATVV